MPQVITIIINIFLGAIFIIGLLYAIIPKVMWKTFESWKATKEPTAMFFIARRVAGIVIMVIIVAMFLIPYIMYITQQT